MPRIIKPSVSLVRHTPNMLDMIEEAARMCYLSEPKQHEVGHAREQEQLHFIRSKIRSGHLSVLEHAHITMDFVFNRGVSHELVRHRLASMSQESTRYCNYTQEKFGEEITVIDPIFFQGEENFRKMAIWLQAMRDAEQAYFDLLSLGAKPEEARDVLPNALKTKMRFTANVREWRHILALRSVGTTGRPHPQMKEVMDEVARIFLTLWPVLFEDLKGD